MSSKTGSGGLNAGITAPAARLEYNRIFHADSKILEVPAAFVVGSVTVE
jgi:hypothetical protein